MGAMTPPRVIHDLPRDDLIEHAPDERCVCGPYRTPLDAGTGPRTFVCVHQRLDAASWKREPPYE